MFDPFGVTVTRSIDHNKVFQGESKDIMIVKNDIRDEAEWWQEAFN